MRKVAVIVVVAAVVAAACGGAVPTEPPTTPSESPSTTVAEPIDSPVIPYRRHCAACHGPFGLGESGHPAIVGLADTYDAAQMSAVIVDGQGTMPGTPGLSATDVASIVEYVRGDFRSLLE